MLTKSEKIWIKSLQEKTVRYRSQEFVAEGIKLVTELLREPESRCKLLLVSAALGNEYFSGFSNIERIEILDIKMLQSVSSLKRTDSVLGIFDMPDFEQKRNENDAAFILYLDHIGDPGNMGTIIRTADWFGLERIFCSEDCVDPFNNKVVQASMASIMRVKVVPKDWSVFRKWVGEKTIFAATLEGESYLQVKPDHVQVLCIGNESKGLSEEILKNTHRHISIPRAAHSRTESLNAAVAASVFMAWRYSQ